jgi:hypothetical protein
VFVRPKRRCKNHWQEQSLNNLSHS